MLRPFLHNVVQRARGGPSARRIAPAAVEGIVMAGALVALIAALAGGIWAGLGSADKGGSDPGGAATTASTPAQPTARGKSVFASSGCGTCHTLKAAGAAGRAGPNLDQRKPAATLVSARVSDGKGAMPAYRDRLSDGDIEAVAAYVAESAGK